MGSESTPIRFIDLFAGLGGFHVGLRGVRGTPTECVFACELDPELRKLYERNFRQPCFGDITKIEAENIPDHDVLCAGFPCQPFSKAGEQKGLNCGANGDLFEKHLVRIIRHHQPAVLLLENVPNLEKHDNGRTWSHMCDILEEDLGYRLQWRVLSPDQYGMPQVRRRMYIVGSRRDLGEFSWPTPKLVQPSIDSVLDDAPKDAKQIPQHYSDALELWDEFVRRFPSTRELPSFPIWGMEFGATYPFESSTPATCHFRTLHRSRGVLGCSLKGLSRPDAMERLPAYARERRFPGWKQDFIRQNRELYTDNKSWIDGWKKQLVPFAPSLQKLEWNCKGEKRTVWKHIVQFRASGIRVKRATAAPALVAMTTTQVPVIAAERRYMTLRECSKLQRLGSLKHLPSTHAGAFRALGNAVNAEMIRLIATRVVRAGLVRNGLASYH